jgi:hypothetical protein
MDVFIRRKQCLGRQAEFPGSYQVAKAERNAFPVVSDERRIGLRSPITFEDNCRTLGGKSDRWRITADFKIHGNFQNI